MARGFFGRVARRAGRAVLGPVGRVAGKVVGTAFRMSPLGAAAGLALGGYEAYQAFAGGRRGGAPSMPEMPPEMTGFTGEPPPGADQGGAMGAFNLQAAGKKSFAMPEMTIDMIRQLEAAGLMTGFSQLRTFRRSPRKDHVVVHPVGKDGQVATFALNKKLARSWGLWKAADKPPISAGDWNKVRTVDQVRKKLQAMNADMKRIGNFGSKPRQQLNTIFEAPGRKLIGRKT